MLESPLLVHLLCFFARSQSARFSQPYPLLCGGIPYPIRRFRYTDLCMAISSTFDILGPALWAGSPRSIAQWSRRRGQPVHTAHPWLLPLPGSASITDRLTTSRRVAVTALGLSLLPAPLAPSTLGFGPMLVCWLRWRAGYVVATGLSWARFIASR
jgi:hypothetical protein